MTVAQTGKTTTSVTINVSEITEGDRQTYIAIPPNIIGGSEWVWYTLQNAKSYGYISDYYVTDINQNNGDITIEIPNKYAREYKVWYVEVHNVNTSSGDKAIRLPTILGFTYENSQTKKAGKQIDVTVEDMRQVNKFGGYIEAWVNNGEGIYYSLDDEIAGDEIDAEYLWQPAQNLLNTAIDTMDLLGWHYNVIANYASYIVDYCKTGAPFEAHFFLCIYHAINQFYLSYSY